MFSIKHAVCNERCRYSEPLLIIYGMVGTLLKSKIPDANQGEQAFLRIAVTGLLG